MNQIRTLLSRLASLFRSRKLDAALDEEFRSHIDLATEENIHGGMSRQQARTAALRSFGGVTQTREAYRNQRGLPILEVLARDLAFAWRQLWKSPGFTLTCFLTLALGIGVNTAIFSMMDAIILHPLAVPGLDRVVTIAERQTGGIQGGAGASEDKQVSFANYTSWQQQSQSFDNLAIRSYVTLSLTGAGDAARVQADYTSANFFAVLKAIPFLGRAYSASECLPGHDDVALLSFGFWKKHFASDPAILGRRILLDGRAYTPNQEIFGELTYHDYYDPERSIRTETHKLIANFSSAPGFMDPTQQWRHESEAAEDPEAVRHPYLEFYDLTTDPWELHNLADSSQHAPLRDKLAHRLYQHMVETDDPLLRGAVTSPQHEKTMKMLQGDSGGGKAP